MDPLQKALDHQHPVEIPDFPLAEKQRDRKPVPVPTRLIRIAIAILSMCFAQADWPQFRGPHGDGHYPPRADGKPHGFPTEWSESKNVVWKTPVTGRAWSTPVVMGDQVWLTNATEDGKKMYAVCLDRNSGRKIHDLLLFENENPEALGNRVNGYGSCSPALDEERVYVHFGSYGTAALDRATGKVVWQRRDLPCNHFRGPGSSLALYKDTLILTMDGTDVQYLAALDRKTGKTVWKTDRTTDFGDVEAGGKIRGDGDFRKAYSTPGFVTVDGRTQLVSPGAKACYGYNADTGKELWKVTYKGYSNAASPVFIDGKLAIINTGFGKPHLIGVRLDGKTTGDVTRSHVEWDIFKRIPKLSSPVVIDGKIYVTSDMGILSRIHAASGEVEEFIQLGGSFAASGVFADGLLYLLNEEGETKIVRPGEKMEIVATNTLDDGFMASPALAGSELYLRTRSHVYRIEEK